jgi:hypothetical protein
MQLLLMALFSGHERITWQHDQIRMADEVFNQPLQLGT